MKPHTTHFLKMSFSYPCILVGTVFSRMAVGGKIPGFDILVYVVWGFIAFAYAREVVVYMKKRKSEVDNS
ncbi:hypothetical protein Echvi_2237 [Echinicola vietnamensis DSM 17526]|uniref:Uncharacterized protein n=1 Tax=Echinicola vietnamensis (strain DSM 17526 / LMG 23754 / KMM 6221) TaxID=926556 RepID=L0FYW5_ECHVK|nr:hypothetical protein Echvi_2237 [Echinicola vietnamensis DSM 17526]